MYDNYLMGCAVIGAAADESWGTDETAKPAKPAATFGPITEAEARAQGWKPAEKPAASPAPARDPFADLAPTARPPVPPPAKPPMPAWKKAAIGGGLGVGLLAVVSGLVLALRRR